LVDPCLVEIPWLIDMQAKYAARGFTVVGVAMDEEGKSVVAPFIAKERFDVNGQQLPMGYPSCLAPTKPRTSLAASSATPPAS